MGASAPLSLLYFVFIVYVLCISPVEYWNQINLDLLHAARCTNLTEIKNRKEPCLVVLRVQSDGRITEAAIQDGVHGRGLDTFPMV